MKILGIHNSFCFDYPMIDTDCGLIFLDDRTWICMSDLDAQAYDFDELLHIIPELYQALYL